jgi:hypothetical protein
VRKIAASDVIVSHWVRFKCRYGCKGYGKHMGCPPYGPAVEDTRKMVSEYETGILVRFDGIPGHHDLRPEQIPVDFHPFFRDLILWVNGTIHLLEKTAFYDGYYTALPRRNPGLWTRASGASAVTWTWSGLPWKVPGWMYLARRTGPAGAFERSPARTWNTGK